MTELIHSQLERSAIRNPDRVAVAHGAATLTYAELDARANQIAHLLTEIGSGKGHRVGLLLDKSLDAVAGLYAVMKAGAAYVPLDPAAPTARIAHIVSDCAITTLISQQSKTADWAQIVEFGAPLSAVVTPGATAPRTGEAPAEVEVLDRTKVAEQPATAIGTSVDEDDLALILYTSGSTGNPKGVMLSHRNVMAFVGWAADEFAVTERDRLSQFAPLHFDLSTFDLFAAARTGASVHMASRQTTMFPMAIRRFLEAEKITVAYSVPSILTALTERAGLKPGDLTDLRIVLFAGEVFPTKYLSRIMHALPHAEFANLFGPTETNVCTFYRLPEVPAEDGPPVLIGRAIAGVETSVVATDGVVVDTGEPGELWVRGPTVMQGYWGRAPSAADSEPGLYRTGDLVRETETGDYEFIGRRDNQIKSRGYRIELGDIEAAMLAHPQVLECAVIPVPDDQVTNRITACVVMGDGFNEDELIRFLADRLPKYMIPETIEYSESLPKTSTGKIDRQLLLGAATKRRSQ